MSHHSVYDPAIHQDFDREGWPRYMIFRGHRPFGDGVLYVEFQPDNTRGVCADGRVMWEMRGNSFNLYDNHELFNQVSPLYVLALQMHYSEGAQ